MAQQDVSDMSPEEIAELQKENCIFCKIAAGDVPSKKIYEDGQMMAVHDIRPATKGHVVVFPKEHYPILPLVPEDTFNHLFTKTKELTQAVRQAVPATGDSVFVANGAAAGQQSPHFLFHIIPRDEGDNLDALDLPKKEIDQSDILDAMRKNVGTTMKNMLAEQGKLPGKTHDQAKDKLAKVLEQNPQVKELLAKNPEKFKEVIANNPQMKQLFHGIDIDRLSEQLSPENKNDSGDAEGGGAPDKRGDDSSDSGADLDKVSRLFK